HFPLPRMLQVPPPLLALLPPHHHVVPLGALLALSLAVVRALAGGDRNPPHRLSSSRETHLRILPEVADQQHLVHRHRRALRIGTIDAPSQTVNAMHAIRWAEMLRGEGCEAEADRALTSRAAARYRQAWTTRNDGVCIGGG